MSTLTLKLLFLLGSIVLTNAKESKFTFLQFSDVNAQLEPFEKGTDPPKPLTGGVSSGGLGPMVGEMRKAMDDLKGENVYIVSTGNLLGGANGWLSILGWKKYAEAVTEHYKSDFMAVGLQEFEVGLNQTNTYLGQIVESDTKNTTVLVSNVRKQQAGWGNDEEQFYKKIKTFSILDVDGQKIGLVGFVNPLVMNLSDPGGLVFDNIVTSLKTVIESAELADVKSFVAIGSGTSTIAKQILDGVDKVKLVMYSGGSRKDPDTRMYPEKYGEKYIAYSPSFKYGASFGSLNFTIKDGDLTLVESESGPKVIGPSSQIDKDAVAFVKNLTDSNEFKTAQGKVGNTLVKLEGSREVCWRSECNLGNLVADAMVHCAVNKLAGTDIKLDDLIGVVAVWHSGALFNDVVEPIGDKLGREIRGIDIHTWLPYHNMATLVAMRGSVLKQMFQTSGQGITADKDANVKDWGQFLQVSNGLDVHYSTEGVLESVRTLHVNDSKPVLQDVDDSSMYHVVIPSFLAMGRSVYGFLKDALESEKKVIDFDDLCLTNYITAASVLKIGFEERIFIGEPSREPCTKCNNNTATTVVLTLIIFLLIVGTIFVAWKFAWPYYLQRRRTSSFP